ncbi:MAG: hypothetical protein A3C93_01220 [Candidatus Lloydbacteria bacterium RIFCSPHIGHO2_02_FULL_54_17]|uniref:CusB-like beta-barrel domain-containing protein n=1 Tax=Candidatus Lloydbacteria bacterium RIFCSPHIGHO2_02_FULL_54_17 TaxID=1798664 RepID=A0A1G2DCT9_9BACT|nr:MAG: hypothetical protein A2762_02015 [Candidatus Lloydbacteria bacterium RIFCSPHIGHO2_01_FULL_54_11]OGZ10700.1 MAG: hypothetical protein A3C93_01220 [Candidatus Lloydbacteria bacterium RIFCSPHIGHO2_02_FULL_54_17]OGZ12903.1 MAG: hypothetical protein A2948_00715 [Candidatus Lloydbacteria bacterium RIFCSPLOWO2_01_FULL_54_18]OGZ15335.1 MAG: hypothetical protein A3H76_06900 [Candidatus Lloydbacteria bacterium RIFCSPLOWO2_02_FULL_54_12]
MRSSFHYLKSHKFFIFVVVLALLGGGVFYFKSPALPTYETARVEKGDVIQEVSVTGRVESEREVALAFERGGRVVAEPVQVGSRVGRGDVLVRLDSSELAASRLQVEANLDYEIATLAQLQKGARPEDIAVSEARAKSAAVSLDNAMNGAVDTVRGAYSAADDAVRNKTDIVWRNPRTLNPELIIPATDSALANSLPALRVEIEKTLNELTSIAKAAEEASDETALTTHLEATEKALFAIKEYLNKLALTVNGLFPSSSLTQASIDTYKANVASARTSIEGTLSALLGAEKEIRSAASALAVANDELALKRGGPTGEAILAQEAKIASVRASLANYDVQIAKMTLTTPFSGVVTKQSAKLGATVAPNEPLLTIQSNGAFKITANIPEVDVAKITIGDKAEVTLDAYGDTTVFPAAVSSIDPAETVIEGVPTYKVTLYFNDRDERVRSGMTANLDILTEKREGVLRIPTRAVTTKEGKKVVRVTDVSGLREVIVETGLRGSDGTVEIVAGLSEGDEVVTFEGK